MNQIRKRGVGPDFFTLDSGDGGTGAAPMALIDNIGLSIRESSPLVRDIIKKHDLAECIPTIASGKRFHVRIVGPDGVSRPLSELFPTVDPADSNAAAARRLAG